jgi:hypothetical protein
MHNTLALFVEHDWIDTVNACSTIVIALFTVAMFLVVRGQLRASKDIERSWVMPTLEQEHGSPRLLDENATRDGDGKITFMRPIANLLLTLKNSGRSPVWVKHLHARLVLVDSEDSLPKKPQLNDEDSFGWFPPPFTEQEYLEFQLADKVTSKPPFKDKCVIYGKVTYLDIFRQERFSTFGYVVQLGSVKIERLAYHPEYNRNT